MEELLGSRLRTKGLVLITLLGESYPPKSRDCSTADSFQFNALFNKLDLEVDDVKHFQSKPFTVHLVAIGGDAETPVAVDERKAL